MNADPESMRVRRRSFLASCARVVATTCVAASVVPKSWVRAADAPSSEQLLDGRARKALDRGLTYLASRQAADGSFGTGGLGRNVGVCGLCGMAFLAAGHVPGRGKYGAQVERCLDFILAHAADNGFICDPEALSRGPMYGHGFATLFLAEVYGMSGNRRTRDRLASAVRLIVDTQNAEGGWRYEPRRHDADISVTVCQVMALRAARNAGIFVPNETIDGALEYVRRLQDPDGSFRYQADQSDAFPFPRSAAALVALYSAGVYEGEEIRRGLDYLSSQPPRSNSAGDQKYFFYGHYYAVQAMWHAGGTHWQNWYPAVRDLLVAEQRDDGSWLDKLDTANPEYGTALSVLILHMPSNYLPIFQR